MKKNQLPLFKNIKTKLSKEYTHFKKRNLKIRTIPLMEATEDGIPLTAIIVRDMDVFSLIELQRQVIERFESTILNDAAKLQEHTINNRGEYDFVSKLLRDECNMVMDFREKNIRNYLKKRTEECFPVEEGAVETTCYFPPREPKTYKAEIDECRDTDQT